MSFESYDTAGTPDFNEWGDAFQPYGEDVDHGDHGILPTEIAADGADAEQRPQAPGYAELYPNQAHQVARTQVNAKLITIAQAELGVETVERVPVPDEYASWDTEYPGYEPPYIDVPRGSTAFRKEGDVSDPADPRLIEAFTSLEGEVQRDQEGYPLNPFGRTGIRGRGILDKWGPTAAADPILTRHHPDSQALEVLLIQRGDTGEWALPGGKVDPGEAAWQAAERELGEEASARGVEIDFSTARVIYQGYGDDSRNTDNSWFETTVLHHHLNEDQARVIVVEADSDADAAQWVAVSEELYANLFSSHGEYIRRALSE